LGKRQDEQQEMWVATTSLPKSEGHSGIDVKIEEAAADNGCYVIGIAFSDPLVLPHRRAPLPPDCRQTKENGYISPVC
jgi:hypothetical protein